MVDSKSISGYLARKQELVKRTGENPWLGFKIIAKLGRWSAMGLA
jgi:hypothetical protein